jgi:hypothetical protein
LGEKGMALTWLERGVSARTIAAFYKDEPVWDTIRNESRFSALLPRLGFPQ